MQNIFQKVISRTTDVMAGNRKEGWKEEEEEGE
jgi:hypothetical protein